MSSSGRVFLENIITQASYTQCAFLDNLSIAEKHMKICTVLFDISLNKHNPRGGGHL